jgi:hypothetical protein
MRTAAGTVVKMPSVKGVECFPRDLQVRVYASDFVGGYDVLEFGA